ncbi:MAG: family 1 glycosylhydrolase [Bacteroidota bacterium]
MSTEIRYPFSSPEIWGGIECTVNRVDNVYRDQLADTGHYLREDDIHQFAKLGIKRLRYPVLWENHQPGEHGEIDWSLTAVRLGDIRRENIVPIAGLLHHGSGPIYTDLLDDKFPHKLAAHAAAVAAQFPWLEYYTPVNEPLTTARFSGMYGLWYPHHRDEKSFIRMLLNQVKGIILSMQTIRKINPSAKLVQTEDLCKVHSTAELAYQVGFENERRWLTYDLLCGLFKPGHVFWNRFLSLNIKEEELHFFADNSCPPDIMGFNYYVTSERWLDTNLDHYPSHLHGGNGRHRYVDTEAARTGKSVGIQVLLEEAWRRYRLPMAVTECYLNCTREEQLRWLKETWDACCALLRKGIPVKAVTAWSLLGSFDWDSLLQERNDHYEPGVFDISAGYRRPTLQAKMIRALASGKPFGHPVLANKGWWQKPAKLSDNSAGIAALNIVNGDENMTTDLEQVCQERRIPYHTFSFADFVNVSCKPWGIVLTTSDPGNNGLYRSVVHYGHRFQIPVMVMAISGSYHAAPDTLLVCYRERDGMEFAHQAMDLFLDEEKGNWRVNQDGARKLTIQPAAVLL